MFLLVSGRHVGAHLGEHQHGASIQISINLGKTFLRISTIRKIAVIWILARVFAYLATFFLFPDSGLNLLNGFDFLFWSILNGVTLKTSNWWPWISWQSIEVRIVKCFNWYWFPVRRGFRCYLTCIRPVVSRAVLLTGLVGLGLGWLLWCMLGMLSCHMLFEATAFPEWWFTLQTFKGFLIWNFTKKMTISSL